MIDEKRIMSKLGKFAASSRGKAVISNRLNAARSGTAPLTGGGNIISEADMAGYGAILIGIIKDCMPDQIRSAMDGVRVIGPVKTFDGSYRVVIHFDKDSIARESLEAMDYSGEHNGRTGDGVDNIIALFNNGYKASKTVYGWWDKHEGTDLRNSWSAAWVPSRKEREPLMFMQDAARIFEARYGAKLNVLVELGEKYKDIQD